MTRKSATVAILEGLNPEQVQVVTHTAGPLVTGAVAGAGKTASLVRRIAYLVLETGADPARILAVTFSSKAAREMNDRLHPLLGAGSGARVGTFHSLAWEIVRREDPSIARWELDERDRYRSCVKEALGYRGMDWKSADLTVVLQFIGRCKARCAMPGTDRAQLEAADFYAARPCSQRTPALLAEAYARTEEIRVQRRLVTFDDMLLDAWHRLATDEACRVRWASRWDYVLQDEAQDENLVQREIASMLARDHRNYMVVGDPAQSIYAFRGSDPSGILAFESTWGARKVLMHRNYRCADSVVRAANGVLAAMPGSTHLGATITACRGVEGVVTARSYEDMDAEAVGVVEDIVAAHNDGRRWKDNVILYRTNAQSRALEDQMLSARIPYVVVGGVNFYERKEIKDVLAYVRLAAGRGNSDDVRRSINAPFRFLGKAFVEGLMALADRNGTGAGWTATVRQYLGRAGLQSRQRVSAEQWCSLIDACAANMKRDVVEHVEGRPGVMLQEILDETQYVQWLQRDEGSESTENNRVSNIRELVRAAERFATVHEFLDYVDIQIEAARNAKRAGDEDRVTLMSVHRSKGLEWPCVYVVGTNEGILPHGRADDENEERRLAYVAFTRARDALHVSCVRRASIGTRVVDLEPSRFIAEAGLPLERDDRTAEIPALAEAV